MRKPVATTFRITTLVVILFLLYQGYRYYQRRYLPAHQILEAAFLLDKRSTNLHTLNGHILHSINRTTEKIEIYHPHHNEQFYQRITLLRQKAREIYQAGSWLNDNLPAVKDSLYLQGNNLVRSSGKGQEFSEPVQDAEIVVSNGQAEQVHRKLRHYLNLTGQFSQSPDLRRPLQKLRELAEADPQAFYARIYQEPRAYLLLAEISLIRAAIMALEKESLARLGTETMTYDRPLQSLTWVAWPEIPAAPNKTGPGTNFRIRLANAVKIYKWNKPRFRLDGERIDSVADHSVAFTDFPVSSPQTRSAATPFSGKESVFSLRIFIPYYDSDTTFTFTHKLYRLDP